MLEASKERRHRPLWPRSEDSQPNGCLTPCQPAMTKVTASDRSSPRSRSTRCGGTADSRLRWHVGESVASAASRFDESVPAERAQFAGYNFPNGAQLFRQRVLGHPESDRASGTD